MACKTCEWEAETGNVADASLPNTVIAAQVGVGEASVRRHFGHGVIAQVDNEPESRDENFKGDIALTKRADRIIPLSEWLADMVRDGLDPADYNTSHGHSVWGQKPKNGELVTLFANRFGAVRKTARDKAEEFDHEKLDLPLLLRSAQELAAFSAPARSTNRAIHVAWSDAQTGKTDHRGGTPELIERVYRVKAGLERYIEKWEPTISRFMDGGDAIEGFENTGGQMGTNDLSLMEQIDLETTFEFDYIKLLSEATEQVGVYGVGSNHCRWRNGKAALGKPSDDFGLLIKKTLQRTFAMNEAYSHISFHEPAPYKEYVKFDSYGTTTAMLHGHQNSNPRNPEAFWLKQFMGNDMALSHILHQSHYHYYMQLPMGRHPVDNRQRWFIQNPTMDNGSSWYANNAGSDSDPGMVVYIVDENGLNQDSLTILK